MARLPIISAPTSSAYRIELPAEWSIQPFTEFILKVHSLCNLDCDYCYVYHHADQSWRTKPRVMADATLNRGLERIREHALRHALAEVRVVFHGGEPLLLGPSGVRRFSEQVRERLAPIAELHLGIQTNGTLLTDEMLAVLDEHDIRIGLSLDGPAAVNDRHRLDHRGRSTHAASVAGLERLIARHRRLFGGMLAVIDPETDPLEVYEYLLDYAPPILNFLLPDGNWETRPPAKMDPESTPYADWLIPIFDRWFSARPRPTDIRLFSEIMHLLLGGENALESLGLARVSLLIIETDGSYEGTDTLKAAFPGAPAMGMDVFQHDLEEVARQPAVVIRQLAEAALSETCRRCDLHRICGGGYFPHRFRDGSFLHPTIYCEDMMKLIQHIHKSMTDALEGLRAGSEVRVS